MFDISINYYFLIRYKNIAYTSLFPYMGIAENLVVCYIVDLRDSLLNLDYCLPLIGNLIIGLQAHELVVINYYLLN